MIKKIRAFVTAEGRARLIKDVSTVFLGSTLSRLLNFISFLLIAKGLSVPDYGILSVLLSLIATLGDLVNSGLTASTMRYTAIFNEQKEKEKIGKLLSTSILNTIILTLIVVIVTIFASGFLSQLLFKADYRFLLVISAVGILTTFLYSNLNSILQGLQDFKGMFILSLVFGIERLIPISLLFFGQQMSIPAMVFLFAFTPFTPILIGLWLIISRHKVPVSLFKYDIGIVKEMFDFGKWMSLWSVVAIVQSRMDVYLLSILTTTTQVALYDVSGKFVSIVGMGLGAYANVINPKIASFTDKEKIKNEIRKIVKVTALLTLGLVVGFIVLPFVIQIIFGPKYDGSLLPLRIMLGGLVFYLWTFPFNSALYAIGKSNSFFFTALFQLIANTIASLVFLPSFGAVGASFSYVIVNAVALAGSYFFYRKYFIAGDSKLKSETNEEA